MKFTYVAVTMLVGIGVGTAFVSISTQIEPRGKDLQSEPVQLALCSALQMDADNAAKLFPIGSSQSDKSFHDLIASKAPKTRHYTVQVSQLTYG